MGTPASAIRGATAARMVGDAAAYGLRFLRMHIWRMLLWFFCLLLPLWGFAALVGEVQEKALFPFDAPILNLLHALATPTLDHLLVVTSRVGYLWGVVPLDAIILVLLVTRRRFRDGLFFGISVMGSAILNIVAKNHFARLRPDLWLSITPESTYSFPSGHAMGSATLGMAVIILCWPTRWRLLVLTVTVIFVLLVGVSRVYLGVHYPSDILAGWTAAIAWTFGMYILVDQKAPPPPPSAAPQKDVVGGNPGATTLAAIVPLSILTLWFALLEQEPLQDAPMRIILHALRPTVGVASHVMETRRRMKEASFGSSRDSLALLSISQSGGIGVFGGAANKDSSPVTAAHRSSPSPDSFATIPPWQPVKAADPGPFSFACPI